MVFSRYDSYPVTHVTKEELDSVLVNIIEEAERKYDGEIYEYIDLCYYNLTDEEKLTYLRGSLSFYLNNRSKVGNVLGPIKERRHDSGKLHIRERSSETKNKKIDEQIEKINAEYNASIWSSTVVIVFFFIVSIAIFISLSMFYHVIVHVLDEGETFDIIKVIWDAL